MSRLAALLPVLALSTAACQTPEAPAAAPARPPGEVYTVSAGAFFVRPPSWLKMVLPRPSAPVAGATSGVAWRMRNQDTTQQTTVFSFYTFTPDAWAAARSATPPVGAVVFEDSARVIVAALPEANPYPAGSEAATRFDDLSIPLDTIRARLIVR